jgi:hypothetical protein
MPVSYAMRKLSNDFPLAFPVVPPDADVVVPLAPPPPHAAAISEMPTARDAAMTSHFHGCLRVKSLPPKLDSMRKEVFVTTPRRDRAFLLTFPQRSR